MELQRQPDMKDSRVGGQIHLRLKWCTGDLDDEDSNGGILLKLSVKGVGISLVEASYSRFPRELMVRDSPQSIETSDSAFCIVCVENVKLHIQHKHAMAIQLYVGYTCCQLLFS